MPAVRCFHSCVQAHLLSKLPFVASGMLFFQAPSLPYLKHLWLLLQG